MSVTAGRLQTGRPAVFDVALMGSKLGWMARPTTARPGFTLVEMVVVLILMGLAAALVAPALLAPHRRAATVSDLVESAREAAARRGEVLHLTIEPTGQWRLESGANPLEGTLAAGRVEPFLAAPVTLIVSPLGSCAFDVRSTSAASALALEPLTCEIRTP